MLNEHGKFGAKIFSHFTDIVIFMLGYFNLNRPLFVFFSGGEEEAKLVSEGGGEDKAEERGTPGRSAGST